MATAAEPIFAVLGAAHGIQARLESGLEAVGLSGARHQALTLLVEAGEPLALSEIADRLACVRSNVTQLIDRLEAEGLVRRASDPSDRRAVRAELTDSGVERQAAGAEVVTRLRTGLEARITPAERAFLQRVLAALQ